MKQMRLTTTALLFLTSTVWAGMRQPGYPVPQIVGPTNPQSVAPGGTGFTLTIYGANFIPGSTVNWNRQPRATTYISAPEPNGGVLRPGLSRSTRRGV